MIKLHTKPIVLAATILCCIVAAVASGFGKENDYRTFTNTEGKEIRAKLIDKKGGVAHLRMTDGMIYRVPITKLSQGDREYVDSWDPVAAKEEKLRNVDLEELFTARGFKGVPLELKNSQSLLEITIGKETLTFLLDTGAQSSVLNRANAEALKLDIKENVGFAGGIGGKAGAIGMTRLDSVKVGEVKKKGVHFAVMDLSSVSGKHGTSDIDGIIGLDLLKELEAVIDYKAAVLYLRED